MSDVSKNSIKKSNIRSGLFLLSAAVCASCLSIIISAFVLLSASSSNNKVFFFGVDETKELSALVSFDKPNFKTAIVSNWVAEALSVTFDFNYTNMAKHLEQESSVWFTAKGKEELIKAMQMSSGYFSEVLKKQAIVQLTLRQAPVFVKGRVNPVSKKYEWIFQIPVLFTYTMNNSDPEVSDALITLSVERSSNSKNERGLGINRMIISK